MDRAKPQVTLRGWGEAYGPIFRFGLGPKQFVAVTDHTAIQQLLRDRPDKVRRMRDVQEVIDEFAGTGLFSAEGETWRRQRRLTAPAFHSSNLKLCFEEVETVTRRLLRVLQQRALAGGALEIQRELMRYAVDVTTWLSTEFDINSLETQGDAFQRDLEEGFPAVARRVNAIFPYWRYVELPRDRRLNGAVARLKARLTALIDARRGSAAPVEAAGAGHLLRSLIVAHEELDSLSKEELLANILTILLAGEDTTADGIAWAIMFIADDPAVQHRLREEAKGVLGERRLVESYDDLSRLEYIQAVAFEALRLRPPAPFLFLEANEALEILDTAIPQGTNIVALTAFDALREENFTHAREFRPERWMGEERNEQWAHNVRAFMPFGSGPRMCPGRSLAIVEITSVLAMIGRNFQVTRSEADGPVDERNGFSVGPVNLRVTLREDAG